MALLPKYKKHQALGIALIAVLTLAVFIFCRFMFHSLNSPEHITEAIQNEFSTIETQLTEKTNLDSLQYQNKQYNYFFRSSLDHDDFQFYLFKNDSLILWNGNWLPVVELIKVTESQKIIKTSNGYYLIQHKQMGNNVKMYGAYRLQTNFRYQNKYLHNRLDLNGKAFDNTEICDSITPFVVYNKSNQPVFNLSFKTQNTFSDSQFIVLFILYIILHTFAIVLIIKSIKSISFLRSGEQYGFLAGILVLILLRFIQISLKFPEFLYEHKIFGPQVFTFKWAPISLGDLMLDIVALVVIITQFRTIVRKSTHKNLILVYLTGIAMIVLFNSFLLNFVKSIIFDSIIPFNFNQIYYFDYLSVLAIIMISTLIYCGYELFSGIFKTAGLDKAPTRVTWVFLLIGIIVYTILYVAGIIYLNSFVLSVAILLILLSGKFMGNRISNTIVTVLFVLLNSVVLSLSIYFYQQQKDDNNQIMAASELSSDQRDPVVEYLFSNLENRFTNDISIQNKLDSIKTNIDYPMMEKTIRDQYFSGYWTNFDVQLTICEPEDTLKLIPETYKQNCYHYFQGLISDFGEPTSFSNLQFINYGPGDKSYLASFIIETGKKEYKIYAEITPKNYGSELGLPDLLIDEEKGNRLNDLNYSTALYLNGVLYSHSGDYNYHQLSNVSVPAAMNFMFTEQDGYKHIYYKTNSQKQIVVSRKKMNFFEKGAPFTFFLLVLTTFFAIAFQIQNYKNKTVNTGLQSQLQRFISFVLVVSFVFTAVFSVIYINQFNNSKVEKDLNEKTHSVMLELQYKIASSPSGHVAKDFFDELLIKFSSVFFTDINIYGLDGRLISTSRPQVFNEGIIGDQMNPDAFYQMSVQKKSFLIHNEDIGKLQFLSSYMPVKDINNKIVAYLNLPYFARQAELQTEVLAFLVRFVNIFLLILIGGLSIGFLLANYFSKPLLLLINNMKTVTLGGRNSLPEWKRKDEIGELIRQYNTLLAELEESARKLAISERESAWREMARQIAHEIKNPLTPMKLSVQFLKKAWDEKDPKWEEKYSSFTTTMIDQIDALSQIASDFSDFSKIKTITLEPVNLSAVAQNSVLLFSGNSKVEIEIHKKKNIQPVILADKDQMTRLFNNLIKNAVQAVEYQQDGKVVVQMAVEGEKVIISVSDNGPGIPAELKEKIFQPNFTTKTGGMGLGLAIAKAITESFHGTIDHRPNHKSGTTFTLTFPLFVNFNNNQ